MRKDQQYAAINGILMDWNPVGVEGPALFDEYASYAPRIFERIRDRQPLTEYLRELLEELGLDFDPDNDLEVAEINELVQKIMDSIPSDPTRFLPIAHAKQRYTGPIATALHLSDRR